MSSESADDSRPGPALTIPARRAVEILTDRIASGEQLSPDESSTFLEFRDDVLRWVEENSAILQSIYVTPPSRPSAPLSVARGITRVLLPNTTRWRTYSEMLSRDLRFLSGCRYAIGIAADIDLSGFATSPGRNSATLDPNASLPSEAHFEPVDVEAPAPPGLELDRGQASKPAPKGASASEAFSELERDSGPDEQEPDEPELEHPEREEPNSQAKAISTSASPAAEPLALTYLAPATAAVAGYDADAVADRDLIGIDRVVDAFSYLIASRAMTPPMAIGLFGPWGSGKTFLMRSIQRRVDLITRGATGSGEPQREIGIYKRVVQIEFNAWHYVEGNLWASLVDHIFANLRTSSEEPGSELHRRRERLTRRLVSTSDERRALSKRITHLQQRKAVAQQQIAELEQAQSERLKEVKGLQLKDVAAVVVLKNDDMSEVRSALARIGVTDVQASALEAARSLADARDLVRRGNSLLVPMYGRGWKWALCLAAIAGVVPATSVALDQLDISSVTQVTSSAAAALALAAAAVKSGTRWASTSLSRIESAEARVRARVDAVAAEHADQIAESQHDLEGLQRLLDQAIEEQRAASAEIRSLEDKLSELHPGRLLADFLEQRSASTDYRRHLGLTALIRRDFEELSRLVAENNEQLLAADDGRAPSTGPADFNRVVLYVDDLDRCPPHRVIEVLQAVHLLLSFPIFVVVVAVDPRWLTQSLTAEYPDLIGKPSGETGAASPQDYLEKIFQIPFNVAPLDVEDRSRLITGLLGPEPAVEMPIPTSAAASAEIDDNLPEVGDGHHSDPAEASDPVTTPSPSDVGPEPIPDTASGELTEPTPSIEETLSSDESHDMLEPIDLNPAGLAFTASERRFLGQLLPLLDASPRGIKRYINIYRLIKSVSGLATEPAPHHEDAMLLLAMQTGLPTVGPDLVRRIAALSPDPPSEGPRALTHLVTELRDSATHPLAEVELDTLDTWLSCHSQEQRPARDLTHLARHVRLYTFA